MSELVVVPHTHWDREWYQPFQRFRLRLVTVLDTLLAQLAADPRARFTLDGQTAAIDDYLEIRPEREELVRELVARGQLALGPWRVLADSFLCSGENLLRNLEQGMRRAEELGGAMRVGYLPDQFGHAAQLPQLLRLAGIAQACVWRGVPEAVRTTEFWWVAPDGTAIRTRYLPEGGYGGAASVFAEPDATLVRDRAEEHARALRRWQPEGALLAMYGTDHSAPVDGLADLVEQAAGLGTTRIRLETLGGFLGEGAGVDGAGAGGQFGAAASASIGDDGAGAGSSAWAGDASAEAEKRLGAGAGGGDGASASGSAGASVVGAEADERLGAGAGGGDGASASGSARASVVGAEADERLGAGVGGALGAIDRPGTDASTSVGGDGAGAGSDVRAEVSGAGGDGRSGAGASKPSGVGAIGRLGTGGGGASVSAPAPVSTPGQIIHGELRSHARANILPGVLSSRIGLKQALSRAERWVERYAEPLAALYGVRAACQPFLDLAWRRLVDASCHDSVTGCGVDATAEQVAARIGEADDLGRGVVDLVLGAVAESVGDGGHVLFNPSGRRRVEVVALDVPAGHVLRNASGQVVAHQVVDTTEEIFADEDVAAADLDRFLRRIHGRELYGRLISAWEVDRDAGTISFELATASELVFDVADVQAAAAAHATVARWCVKVRTHPRATVAALVDVGPLALAAVTGAPGEAEAASRSLPGKNIAAGRRALSDLDNGLVHVALRPDGLLDVLAADGTHAAGLGLIVDGGDLGDEYNYAPPTRDRLVHSPDEIWNRVRWSGPLTGALESARWYNWPTHAVPAISAISGREAEAVSGDEAAGGSGHAAEPPQTSTRAETTHTTQVTTRIELRHGEPFVRLTVTFANATDDHRVRLHLPLPRPAIHSHAEGQFAVVRRGLHAEGGFGERPVPTFPAYGWVAAGGLAVLLDHVSEYELVDDGRTLAITLLRSVGLLSRNDNAWREEPAGPQLATPGAQCHGTRTVELGLFLYAGEWHQSGLLDAAERYRHPFTTVAGRSQNPRSVPKVPAGGIEISGKGVVLSSLRDTGDTGDGEDPELRLVALTPNTTTATISTKHANQSMEMRPWQIVTTPARGARS